MSRLKVVSIYCLVAVFFLSGCGGPRARYRVLSFFFDGVPDPEKVVVVVGKNDSGNEKIISRASTHGPFASRNCGGCHQRGAGNTLILPVAQLCGNCHILQLEGIKWVHGPVVSGGCRICHNPHRSGYEYLLDAPIKEVCFRCHEEKAVMKNQAHEGITSVCTDCHNPHGSDKRYLLK